MKPHYFILILLLFVHGVIFSSIESRYIPDDGISHLPLILIDTQGKFIPDEPKLTASMRIINNGPGKMNSVNDELSEYEGFVGIEMRGQSSLWLFPKKSYAFETRDELGEDVKVSLLGLPEESDWILSASYSDKTFMRNVLTYDLAMKMGRYASRTKWCEVYLNGDYMGIYILMEKIKRDTERVDISKLEPFETDGDDLTGGYIFRQDKIGGLGPDEYFYINPSTTYPGSVNEPFSYFYPKAENMAVEQENYLSGFLENFVEALNSSNFRDDNLGYKKYIDVGSFIDFQIIQEIGNNVDGNRYSTYFYKEKDSKGGKMYAGPVWDFDLAYGNVDYHAEALSNHLWLYSRYGYNGAYRMYWWNRLMEDEQYNYDFRKRWFELRKGYFSTESIMQFLDYQAGYLGEALDRNFERWPIIGQYVWPNYYVGNSYIEDLEFLKDWLSERLRWMDESLQIDFFTSEIAVEETHFNIYPNPFSSNFNITCDNNMQILKLDFFNLQGSLLKSLFLSEISPGQNIEIDASFLPSGLYLLKIYLKDGSSEYLKVIKN